MTHHAMRTQVLKADNMGITKAAAVIKSGGLLAFPTDTVYGLGCDAFNAVAVQKVFTVKNRPTNNPLILLIADVSDVWTVAVKAKGEILRYQRALMAKHWPGALTLEMQKLPLVPDIVTAGRDRVAVRLPDHGFCRALVRAVGHPIVGTSANISGCKDAITAEEVRRDFEGKVNLIVDDGECRHKIASTVVDVVSGQPKVIRWGTILKL